MILYEPVSSLVISLDNKPFHVGENNEIFVENSVNPSSHVTDTLLYYWVCLYKRESEKDLLPIERARFPGWPNLTTLWLCEVYY